MNVGKKHNSATRAGFMRSKLLGAMGNFHYLFSINPDGSREAEFHLYDEDARKAVEAACLQLELGKVEAYKILQRMV